MEKQRPASPRLRGRALRGWAAEWLAATWLRACGWSIVAKRGRFAGVEVDLVARRGRRLLVVEVKSRRAGADAIPVEDLVSWSQRRRLELAAEAVASRWALPVRIDLVEVRWRPWPSLRWHRDPWI